MKKLSLIVAVLLLIVCGLLPAEEKPTAYKSMDASKKIIKEYNHAMNKFIDGVELIESTDDFCTAADKFSEVLENIGPEMGAIYKNRTEWFESPPEALEATIKAHQEILPFYDEAMQSIVKYANAHSEDEACQESMRRLNMAVYQMFQ